MSTKNAQIAESFALAVRYGNGGATLNYHTAKTPRNVYVVGGVGTYSFKIADYPRDALYRMIKTWLDAYDSLFTDVGTVGVWLNKGIVHLDGIETIFAPSPALVLESAARQVALYRGEIAFGYLDGSCQFTEFQSDLTYTPTDN